MKKSLLKSSLLCASAAFVLVQASDALANPTGATVVAGGISINSPQAGKLIVNQSTDKAVINWQSFDILGGESTQFVQPNSSSIALNRVGNGNPTQILGSLSANGKLVIVNPNGVFFGAGSRVDVAGLVASTADTTDADFLAGKSNFSIAGKDGASIVNKGSITAAEGGLVALVAPSVRNDGVIVANMGTVALAGAQTASVDFYGDNLYSFALGKEAASANSGVQNNGTISVAGGKVLMTAKVAKGVVDNVINNTGIIEASSAHAEGGTIVLDGGDGNVSVAGKLNASGKTGGKITVTGENIKLASATLDASGANAGGSVKVGGDYQGGGTTPHAKTVSVDAKSKINVSATDAGNGGTAVVWSDEKTDFNGTILGTAGKNGGNGGLAEVSSKGELGFDGFADLHADNGKNGSLLLDPTDEYIGSFVTVPDHSFVSAASIVAILNAGTDVIEQATNSLVVADSLIWSGAGSLILKATNIALNADVQSSFAGGTGDKGAITLSATNSVKLGHSNVSTVSGDIKADSVGFKMSDSTISSASGKIFIDNSGSFGSNTADVISGNDIYLRQNGTGIIQNAIDSIHNGAGVKKLHIGSGTWTEALNVHQNNFTLEGNGSLNTIINAPLATTNPVISANNVSNVTVSDLWVKGGEVGVQSLNSEQFNLSNSIVSDTSVAGVELGNTLAASVSGTSLSNNRIGLVSNSSLFSKVSGNEFADNETGMLFNGDLNLAVKDNAVHGKTIQGIVLNDVVQSPIENNSFNNIETGIIVNGGSSIAISKNNVFNDVNFGVKSFTSNGLLIANNIFNNEFTGADAIHNEGGVNFTAFGNSIDNFNNGIVILGTDISTTIANNIKNIITDAVYVGSLLSRIETDSESFSRFASIISTETKSNNAYIARNIINGSTNGIHLVSVLGATAESNNVSNSSESGILAESVSNLFVLNNTITDNFVGINLSSTDSALLSGDVLSNNVLGVNLDNSSNTKLYEETITTPALGTGIRIANASGGNLVRGLNITGGDIGVLVDGTGSSMQFESNTSTFTGQTKYFVLAHDAMFASGSLAQADSLDASQQKFAGTRGSDFTPAQLAAAEGITTDVEDGIATIGNVFYKVFPAPVIAPTGLFSLTEPLFRSGLFSFAGRTIDNNPDVTPQTFDVPALNLSLLSPAAGGGVNPPAPNLGDLGNLEPAAGGNNPQGLAALEPAAGGQPNCGNNFLDAGFKTGFNNASCSTTNTQQ